MRRIIPVLLLIISLSAYTQKTPKEWLNIKGDVRFLRQTKYSLIDDSLVMEASDHRRFQDIVFINIAQPLLLENSYMEFTREGKIMKWIEDSDPERGIIGNEIKVYYEDFLLPVRLEIMDGPEIAVEVKYNLNSSGSFESIEMQDITCRIVRDTRLKVVSENLTSQEDTLVLKYIYLNAGQIQMQFYDENELRQSIEFTFNENDDFVFDGKYNYTYEYDNYGNWIAKTGSINDKIEIKYLREITYF